ncbi:helix-turn-helix domain-containing protein [candidate division KSB1 bacterium]
MKRYLSRKTVAKLLNTTEKTVDRWIRDYGLKATRFGGSVRIAEEDLERFGKPIETIEDISNKIMR